MDIVTIDFETYYSDDYSLSKMTTEAYIRDPQFEIIGVGIKVNNYPTDWYSGDNVGKFLKSLTYHDKAILCHNTAFDGAILSWLFNIRPKLWLDTLSMARPLHNIAVGGSLAALASYYKLGEKGTEVVAAKGKRRADFAPQELQAYGGYCVNDVELTKKLFDVMAKGFPVTEIMVIDKILRMYTEPVIELDKELLRQHLAEVRERKAQLMATVKVSAEELMSNNKFAEVLRQHGVDPPVKTSPTTGQVAYAFAKTDKGMTDLLEHPDDTVQALAAARLGVKSTLEETRTEALLAVADRGALPILLNYYGAHTGRLSGGDKLNLQNFPARSGNNTLRRALKAPDGHVVIACDSSQIEARIAAYIAGQDDLVQAFREKRDVYSEFASEVFGRTITKADKMERFVGKTAVLSLQYGAGAAKFREMLRVQGGLTVELEEAARIVRIYRTKNFRIAQFWNKCSHALGDIMVGKQGSVHEQVAYDGGGIILPNKLRIQYPLLRRTRDGYEYIADKRQFSKALRDRVLGAEETADWVRIYGGKTTENLVQALAALVIREQMVSIGAYYKLAFQVHDEIIIVVPQEAAQAAEAKLVEVMSTPPKWAPGLPVACESGSAVNYGDT